MKSQIHKAEPAPEFAQDTASTCVHCHREIKRVPGGQGSTWVHADSGAVVGHDSRDRRQLVLPPRRRPMQWARDDPDTTERE